MAPEHRSARAVRAERTCPPSQLIGVLMTGMGNDGAAAMTSLRRPRRQDHCGIGGNGGRLGYAGRTRPRRRRRLDRATAQDRRSFGSYRSAPCRSFVNRPARRRRLRPNPTAPRCSTCSRPGATSERWSAARAAAEVPGSVPALGRGAWPGKRLRAFAKRSSRASRASPLRRAWKRCSASCAPTTARVRTEASDALAAMKERPGLYLAALLRDHDADVRAAGLRPRP